MNGRTASYSRKRPCDSLARKQRRQHSTRPRSCPALTTYSPRSCPQTWQAPRSTSDQTPSRRSGAYASAGTHCSSSSSWSEGKGAPRRPRRKCSGCSSLQTRHRSSYIIKKTSWRSLSRSYISSCSTSSRQGHRKQAKHRTPAPNTQEVWVSLLNKLG